MLNTPNYFPVRISCVTLACLALAGYSNEAACWKPDGHTAIGIMAVEQLQPQVLPELESIVNPLTKQAIAEACNWPDVQRRTDAGEWNIPLHFVNLPHGDVVVLSGAGLPGSSA